jgi:hypothetical protein
MHKNNAQGLLRVREQEIERLKQRRRGHINEAVNATTSPDQKKVARARIKALTFELASYRMFDWYCQGRRLSEEQERLVRESFEVKRERPSVDHEHQPAATTRMKKKRKRRNISVWTWRGGRADGNHR